MQTAVFQGPEQGAAWLTIMFAVAEAALADQFMELDKPSLNIIAADMHQAEFADAG